LRALIAPKRSAAQPVIIITIVGRRRGLYESYLGTCQLAAGTRQPFLDGCRALLAMGFHPGATALMKRLGSDAVSLRATIGAAAKLTVDETNGTRFARWKPFQRSAVAPPMHKTAPAYAEGHNVLAEATS
jgi:hypothetical protein